MTDGNGNKIFYNIEEYKIMSVFSNGRALPPEIDLDDWDAYYEASQESYDEMESLIEFCDYDPFEKNYKPSFNENQLAFINRKADSILEDFTKSITGLSKSEKIEILKNQSENIQDKLLFDFIKDQELTCTDFLFFEYTGDIDEEYQKCIVYTSIQNILDSETYNPDDKEISVALNNYKANLNNTLWGEAEKENFEKWRNCKTGSSSVVLTKFLDEKIKAMTEEISNQPEQIYNKPKHKRMEMDWDR